MPNRYTTRISRIGIIFEGKRPERTIVREDRESRYEIVPILEMRKVYIVTLSLLLLSMITISSARATEAKPEVLSPPPAGSAPSIPLKEDDNFPVGETPEKDSAPSPEQPQSQPTEIPAFDKIEEAISSALPELEKEEAPKNYTNMATLQGLNKITARTSALEAVTGAMIKFGTLEIMVKQCWKSSPDETPDSKALLEIWEQKPGEERLQLFTGWMLASSPAISALEHPVYDITIIECSNKTLPKQ